MRAKHCVSRPLAGKQKHVGEHTAYKIGHADPKEFTYENLPLPLSGEIGRSATPLSGSDATHERDKSQALSRGPHPAHE